MSHPIDFVLQYSSAWVSVSKFGPLWSEYLRGAEHQLSLHWWQEKLGVLWKSTWELQVPDTLGPVLCKKSEYVITVISSDLIMMNLWNGPVNRCFFVGQFITVASVMIVFCKLFLGLIWKTDILLAVYCASIAYLGFNQMGELLYVLMTEYTVPVFYAVHHFHLFLC